MNRDAFNNEQPSYTEEHDLSGVILPILAGARDKAKKMFPGQNLLVEVELTQDFKLKLAVYPDIPEDKVIL